MICGPVDTEFEVFASPQKLGFVQSGTCPCVHLRHVEANLGIR